MSSADRLTLEWLSGRYAVCRLEADAPVPAWGLDSTRFISITRTDQELSIVCDESIVPAEVKSQKGFAAMRIVGQVDMASIGIFARLTTALAEVRVPVLVVSTYDTDYLMVCEKLKETAHRALAGVATFR